MEFLDQASKWTDEGRPFDVIYWDFAKAFNKVSHKSLLKKVAAIGIEGKLLEWIADWMSGRQLRVVVDGEESDWRDVLSSVFQGSVLGGILFDVFIDDIEEVMVALVIKFAD